MVSCCETLGKDGETLESAAWQIETADQQLLYDEYVGPYILPTDITSFRELSTLLLGYHDVAYDPITIVGMANVPSGRLKCTRSRDLAPQKS